MCTATVLVQRWLSTGTGTRQDSHATLSPTLYWYWDPPCPAQALVLKICIWWRGPKLAQTTFRKCDCAGTVGPYCLVKGSSMATLCKPSCPIHSFTRAFVHSFRHCTRHARSCSPIQVSGDAPLQWSQHPGGTTMCPASVTGSPWMAHCEIVNSATALKLVILFAPCRR